MEEKLSFIPKKTFNPPPRGRRSGVNFFTLLCSLVFFLSLALWGGLFFYKNYLSDYNGRLSASLDKQKSSFEIASVAEIINLSQKISIANNIISEHKVPSVIFDFLEKNTLEDVRFGDFDYFINETGGIEARMSGIAKNYADIAYQGEVIKDNPVVKSAVFSNFNTDSSNMVRFSVILSFDPSVINYKTNLQQND